MELKTVSAGYWKDTYGIKIRKGRITMKLEDLTSTLGAKAGNLLKEATTGKAGNAANERAEAFKKICALIPNKIDNATVISVLDLMRKQQKAIKKDFSAHLTKNEDAFKKHTAIITKNKGFVEDQNSYTDMAYGDATMQYSGCEIFATYNAIYSITGKPAMSLAKMISEYEKDGMVLSGKFGTAPKAIKDFLDKHGFKTDMTTNEADFDNFGKKFQSLILTMYNDKDDISKEVHTVNISKEGGKYVAHNVYCNGKVVGPDATVKELISHMNGGKAKGISLIGVSKAV